MRRDSRGARLFLLLIAFAAVLFLGGLGRLALFGRDEALYAEAGREMLATGDWVTPRINGAPFFEKPPLYYWLAAGGYWAIGVSPLAARLPSALAAIATVLLTAAVGARVWGARAGLLAGLALATSLQMAVIGRMGILDVPLTCLTLLALVAYGRWVRQDSIGASAAFGVFVGLAVLMKGLAGTIPLAVAVLDALIRVIRGHRLRVSRSSTAVAAICLLAVAAPWYGAMAALHAGAFGSTLLLREHLTRMVQPMQGHGGPVFYYIVLIAVSFFPWVVFVPGALLRKEGDDRASFWHTLCVIWIAYILISFSVVRTKLPGYVTPLFPAMALLVGAELDRRLAKPGRAPWIGVAVASAVLAALISLLPELGERLGRRVGAAHEARRLILPVTIWASGYAVIAVGSLLALVRRPRGGLALMAGGQCLVLAAVLIGILPVLSPYLGGAEARLAQLASTELSHSQVVLYRVRPEAVAFVLGRTVPVFTRDQQADAVELLRAAPAALIAPAEEQGFWSRLPARRTWRAGNLVLLDVPGSSWDRHVAP
jgi:4-amino-4-deoxy-L-arabinose transferase-like glycosyltransferase